MSSYLQVFLSLLCALVSVAWSENEKIDGGDAGVPLKRLTSYNSDVDLDTLQLIRKNDYPAEAHVVMTQDGYLLTLHRIPNSRNNYTEDHNKPVVLLQHGFLSSSADWVITGPNKSLAYILADAGYDVWLGNVRGNTYSSSHTSLSKKDPEFWDFSFDEMGYYDLPAMIDYILNKTGQEQLSYVGHSMGTSVFYAMGSSRPEYNNKIRVMVSLAPVAYVTHMKSPLKLVSYFTEEIDTIQHILGSGEFLPHSALTEFLSNQLCNKFNFQKEICENIFFLMTGFDEEQFNMTLFPVILNHSPSGSSTRTFLHYVQLYKTGVFQPYNCSAWDSTRCIKPPPVDHYNLSDITTPISLHYGLNDWLVDVEDLAHLRSQLRNLVGVYKISNPSFNHIDFLWAKDAPTLVYRDVLKVLKTAQSLSKKPIVKKYKHKHMKIAGVLK